MEKPPTCLCRKEMTFIANNKRAIVWHCQGCGRLLVQNQQLAWQHWYKPEKEI